MTDRRNGQYVLTEDRERVDLDRVHRWLSEESYWAAGRERDVVARSIEGSLPFSILNEDAILKEEEQVGFARVVTDGATFAWICDVFIDPAHRGHGLGTWLIDSVLESLSERGILRFLLATRDAHEVYRRSGFEPLAGAQRFMEIDRRPTRNAILGSLADPASA
ncbi:N-acetyltransferase [Actinoplanes sp. OR16]|uniref:GNAT family N-acetyltransferase n=1 Tax=Actinoplanes sp. OR16 TaxID=946334 RepID=UPI000F6F5654|nr:GNAT family N-acetyltransferase [Actinoplanes sp. OR16]BBH65921.1 N-acetyltransferase [Actinoplanes sp. OR16]